jgi:uroporphyrinogen decarboxylase
MVGRERVNRMFARQDQDSTPRMESFWDDTLRRWRAEGLTEDPNVVLGNDFQGLCWSEPFPFPGQAEVIGEDADTVTMRDGWGQVNRYWKNRQGTPEHIAFPCETRRNWECDIKPRLLSLGPWVSLEGARRDMATARRNGRWCHITGLETFEMTRHLLGDENTMIAMLDEPDYVLDVSNTMTDLVLRDFQYLLDNGIEPDGVWIYGDMAFRSGVICGPPLYRELVWPDHKRMADWAHERGLPFIFHTDGDVNAVIGDYIAAGFDCLQPLEAKAGMDVRKLCPQYGDSMAFFGNCDVMVYATNDRDAIEAEIASKLAAGKATRGYAYHSDHSVPPSVDWQTYLFVIEMVDKHGNYD